MDGVLQNDLALGARGYLQVELMVAIMLLGIMAGVPLLRLDLAHEAAFSQQAQMLATDLRWLQQRSMNISKGHMLFPKVLGDLTPRIYFRMDPDGQYSIVEGTKTLKLHKFYEGVSLGGNYSAIYFKQDGYINVPITIELRQENKRKQIFVDRVGRIRVE